MKELDEPTPTWSIAPALQFAAMILIGAAGAIGIAWIIAWFPDRALHPGYLGLVVIGGPISIALLAFLYFVARLVPVQPIPRGELRPVVVTWWTPALFVVMTVDLAWGSWIAYMNGHPWYAGSMAILALPFGWRTPRVTRLYLEELRHPEPWSWVVWLYVLAIMYQYVRTVWEVPSGIRWWFFGISFALLLLMRGILWWARRRHPAGQLADATGAGK